MTREEALQFKARWQLVNERIDEEIRQTPIEIRFEQLVRLHSFGKSLGWGDKRFRKEREVRARWQRLRRGMNERRKVA
jgi:hypothetical protein